VRFRRVVALGRCAGVHVFVFVCVYIDPGISTPVMRAAVCLVYVSAVKVSCRGSACAYLVTFTRGLQLLCRCCIRCFMCMASLLPCCDVRDRRSVAALSSGMTASGTCGLSGCVVLGLPRTRCCA
jgi:hypothetical protein